MVLVLRFELLNLLLVILDDCALLPLVLLSEPLQLLLYLLVFLGQLIPQGFLSLLDLALQLLVLPSELLDKRVQVGDPLVEPLEAYPLLPLLAGCHIKVPLHVSQLTRQVLPLEALVLQLTPQVLELGE